MKRDMDLVRQILFEIEKAPFDGGWVDVEVEGCPSEEVVYHILLLAEAGLIAAEDVSTYGGPDYRPTRLTWEGHEFLEASRNETIWNKAKALISEKGGGMAFAVLKEVLLQLLRDSVLGGGISV